MDVNPRLLLNNMTRKSLRELNQGKTFILSHNPANADGYFFRKIEFLKEKGFSFVKIGDVWKAIK